MVIGTAYCTWHAVCGVRCGVRWLIYRYPASGISHSVCGNRYCLCVVCDIWCSALGIRFHVPSTGTKHLVVYTWCAMLGTCTRYDIRWCAVFDTLQGMLYAANGTTYPANRHERLGGKPIAPLEPNQHINESNWHQRRPQKTKQHTCTRYPRKQRASTYIRGAAGVRGRGGADERDGDKGEKGWR